MKTYILYHPLTHLFKIGRTISVDQRIRSLNTGAGAQLRLLVTIRADVEMRLHDCFSHKRVDGEWFKLDRRELDSIIGRFTYKGIDIH